MSRSMKKTALSKSLLEMKFMKKSRDDFADEEAAYRWSMYQETNAGGKGGVLGNYVIEPSFVPCEDLVVGRLSFKGMNPEMERLMELEGDPYMKKKEVVQKDETEISDEQMAEQYNTFINKSAQKHKSRKQDANKRGNKMKQKFHNVESEHAVKRRFVHAKNESDEDNSDKQDLRKGSKKRKFSLKSDPTKEHNCSDDSNLEVEEECSG